MDTAKKAIPPEATDKIIDFLEDNPAALVASSRVHSNWRPRAQWLLFTRIFFRDRQAYGSMRRVLQSTGRDSIKKHCEHTTHLEIIDDKTRPYAHAIPLTFSGLFPTLLSITYRNARWNEKIHLHPDPTIFDSLSTFSCVTTLELHTCEFRAFRDFVRFVSAFRSLRDLTLVRVNLGKQSLIIIVPTANASLGKELKLNRFHVEHLVSEETALTELLCWLVLTPSGQTVKELQIRQQDMALVLPMSFHASLEVLLESLGSSITSLDAPIFLHGIYCATGAGSRADIDSFIDVNSGFNTNSQLQSLVLRYTFREEWQIAWMRILRTLTTMASIHLRSLEFVLTIFSASVADVAGAMDIAEAKESWAPINSIIGDSVSGRYFSELKRAAVTLEWHIADTLPSSDVKRLQGAIEEGMKELDWHKRDILVITHHEHSFTLPPAKLENVEQTTDAM
ncbi:hypothetical protein DAEQUDRAFT_612247 [Daedalea quercina L-15889]|uniref:F-box domain-containing protein n=1 Tax=Daedalea quercina L-15889 TaxID=1314783 RepID=A0A165LHR8_9APHY|nr:hypothetical protein DAEQUDRAFT_612247 [Daedalea quercina L-15889]